MAYERYGAALLSSTLSYASGSMAFYIAIVNQSEQDLVVEYPTTQEYDFALEDHRGQEYWRWSKDRVFSPALTKVTVPGGEQGGFHVFGEELEELPMPDERDGHVTLVGELPSTNLPFASRLRIFLR